MLYDPGMRLLALVVLTLAAGCIGWGVPPEARRGQAQEGQDEGGGDPGGGEPGDGDAGGGAGDSDSGGDAGADSGADTDPAGADTDEPGCSEGLQDNDHDGDCTPACTPATCGPGGTCIDSSGAPVCSCLAGYSGPSCSACTSGYQDNDENGTCLPTCGSIAETCSAFACDDSSGTAVCGPCVVYADLDSPAVEPDGMSFATAFTDIQVAIDYAALDVENARCPWGEVWVAAGVYHIRESGPADTLELPGDVDLYGGFAGTEDELSDRDLEANPTVLDGTQAGNPTAHAQHVISVLGPSRLDGFVVRGGLSTVDGSGIASGAGLLARATVTIDNCVFIDNVASVGGGPALADAGGPGSFTGTVFIEDSRFIGNVSDGKGAILLDSLDLDVRRSVFARNYSAESGAAIFAAGVDVVVRDSFLVANQAVDGGGAIYSITGSTLLERSVLAANLAGGGGAGVAAEGGPLIAINTIFHGNDNSAEAEVRGAAAFVDTGIFKNCTFAANDAAATPEAVAGGELGFVNSILAPSPLGAVLVAGDIQATNSIVEPDDLEPPLGAAFAAGDNLDPTSGEWAALFEVVTVDPSARIDTIAANDLTGLQAVTDAQATFVPGALVGRYFDLEGSSPALPILANTATTLYLAGPVLTACTGCDAPYGFFSLFPSATSLARDEGTSVDVPTVDAAGATRTCVQPPLAGAESCIDVGAYELP